MAEYKSGSMAFCLSLLIGLGACTMTTPSQVEVDRLTIKEGYTTSTVMRDEINMAYWGTVADDYGRNSQGPLNIYVAYPSGVMGANVVADRLSKEYKAALVGRGLHAVNSYIVPIENLDESNRVIISFKSLKADVPEDCPSMTGRYGSETLYDAREYKIGCENMRYTAKMVSDPADLLGRSITRDADSRRAGKLVERYRIGEEFEALESSSTSDVGN